MPRLRLSVANAGGHFSTDDVTAIRSGVRAAERFISKHFELDYDVDVVVTAPSYLMPIIPEDGIGGRTYNSRLIVLVIDATKPVSSDFVFETVCHELSHSLRWEKVPDFADTLHKTILFEGLATVLEETAIVQSERRATQFFLKEVQQTDAATIKRIHSELKESFDDTNYDYGAVFFDGNDSLPRWAGYKLGYSLIKQQLARSGRTIYELTLEPYDNL